MINLTEAFVSQHGMGTVAILYHILAPISWEQPCYQEYFFIPVMQINLEEKIDIGQSVQFVSYWYSISSHIIQVL